MLKPVKIACAIALPLLMSGGQSSLPRIQPVATQCLPPPAPAVWFMESVEPNLTQRMLKELSPSPMRRQGADRAEGMPGVCA
jgi:hypothetical protein